MLHNTFEITDTSPTKQYLFLPQNTVCLLCGLTFHLRIKTMVVESNKRQYTDGVFIVSMWFVSHASYGTKNWATIWSSENHILARSKQP